jgi:hypothetical protein
VTYRSTGLGVALLADECAAIGVITTNRQAAYPGWE